MMKKMTLFIALWVLCLTVSAQQLTVQVTTSTSTNTQTGAASLQAAIASSGFALGSITQLEITAGDFTTADWEYLRINRNNLNTLATFTITDDINTVADIPNTTYSNPYFNKDEIKTISVAKVNIIGKGAFATCTSLNSVNFPKVNSINDSAFYGCNSLTSVSFPETTSIEDNVFQNCSGLTSVSFPQATNIGVTAFYNCTSLTSVSFPQATTIGYGAFYNCSALATVSFPQATSIANRAFYNCSALATLQLGTTVPTVGANTFDNTPTPRNLVLVDATGNPLTGSAYNTAVGNYDPDSDGLWKGWTIAAPAAALPLTVQVNGGASYTGATLEDAITSSGIALGNITQLEITAGDFTTADWEYLRINRNNLNILATFTITDGITSVADIPNTDPTSPYFNANSFTTASIQKAVAIGENAFYNCSSLTSASFPQATSIGGSAFAFCNSLTSASFPQATSIGVSAFYYCTSLTSASFPQATSIGNYSFNRCSALTSASFPQATAIGDYAFRNCSSLTSTSFPQATSIGDYAFYKCTSLTTLQLGTTVPTVGANAFKNTPTPRNLVLVDATGTPLTAGSAYNTAKAAYDAAGTPDGDGMWYGWTIADAVSCMTLSTTQTNVSTTGGNDGSLTVTATDGTAPYTYAWSNGETTQTITGLTAGTYTVTVTDAASCSTRASATITEPIPLQFTTQPATSTQSVQQNGTATALNVAVTGGNSPYSYQWYSNTTQSNTGGTSITGATSATYTPITTTAGTTYYYVEVTDSDNTTITSDASGAVTVTAIPYAKALDFDGSNDRVSIPNNSANNITGTQITLEARIKVHQFRDNAYQGGIIVKEGNQQGYMIRAGGNGVVNFNLGSSSWNELHTNDNTLTTGQWYHIAATYDGSTQKIYVNGQLVKSVNKNFSIASTPQALSIGNWSFGTDRGFNGIIDEVRIWNVARTSAQINAYKDKEIPKSEQNANLKAYYRLNQGIHNTNNGSITSVYNEISDSNEGSLENFSLSGTTSNWVEDTTTAAAPTFEFITQPATSGETLEQSATATALTVQVRYDETPSYQWYSNTTASNTGGTAIGGATTASYTPSTATAGTTYYYVVVSNGANSLASSVSGAIVVTPPCDQGYSNNRIYVNASATGTADGKAWATAYTDLQDAIDKAASCNSLTEIWVAGGTYKPSKKPRNADRGTPITTNDARDVSFHLIDGVKLYGGFAGTETTLSDRDLSANTTTLSGDIGTAGNNTDNAYHVVISVSDTDATVLDGFTITGANANGSGTITVETKTIDRNSGGGMFNQSSSPSITNVTFSGNTASYLGGGMYNQSSSSPSITNVTLSGNTASTAGGGMYNGSSSSPSMTNVTFSGNTANLGGGMFNQSSSSPSITNVTLSGNTATNGGGMYNYSSSPSITNVTFSGNTASNEGGGMFNIFSQPKIYNSIFWGNKQGTATNVAGADIENSSSTPIVEHCLTQENSTYSSGTGIINNQDPLFVDESNPAGADGIFGTADDGLRLQAGSPAINAGNNTKVPAGITTDITGAARIQGGTVDMGAYEITPPPCDQGYSNNRIYVNASNTGTADGKAWATAYTDLQDAIDKAVSCNSFTEIWVAGGTYKPSKKPRNADRGTPLTTNDARDVSFHLIDGVKLYGGFAGTEAALADRDPSANTTTLSGDIGTAGNNTDNAYHVVLSVSDTDATVLDGFTITGANANGSLFIDVETKTIYQIYGGGMHNSSSSPSITNVTFSGNTASNEGGGMYNSYSSPSITNVTFSGNTASSFGGGMANSFSSPSITNVTFSGNTASNEGGGMANYSSSSPKIYNSIFWGNKQGTAANVAGADIFNNFTSSTTVEYCLTQENSTYSSGTGIINNQDPLFVDASNPAGADGIFGTADDGLRLQAGSPAINAGNNAPSGVTMPSTDITGAARIQGGTVDMGAYEITLAPPCTAPTNLTATNITLTTADLGFTSSGSEWEIEYGESGFTQGSGTVVSNVTTNPYSLTGLTSGTAYDFYVRELGCTGVIWSVKGTFTTSTPPPCDQGYSNNRIYVNASNTGTPDGKAWATAYTDLQDAIDKAASCNSLTEIWVAGGTYKPSKKPRDTDRGTPLTTSDARDVSFHLIDGVKLYGGFAGTEAALADRDLSANTTTLSGDIGTAGNNTDNAYHVVLSVSDGATTVLNGFTITDGNANDSNYSSITVETKDIYRYHGGGMYNFSSSPSITNVTLSGNTAFSYGGGMFNESSSSPSIINVTFSGNTASDGGGMYNYSYSSPSMTNVTLSGNTATYYGGGMYNDSSSPKIYNSIFWGNQKGTDTNVAGADIFNNYSSSPTVEYCLTQENSTYSSGTGIINNQAPLFVDASNPAGADGIFGTADDGLRLQCASPAINVGNNAPSGVTMPSTDITGAARIQGGTVDMGAYESNRTGTLATSISETSLPTAAGMYYSEHTITDGSIKHYCTCNNELLLSLGDNSNVPDDGVSIKIGSTGATYYAANTGFITNSNGGAIINRTWNAIPTTQPSKAVEVRYYYTAAEFTALNTAIMSNGGTALTGVEQMQFYKVTKSGAHLPVADIATNEVIILNNGTTPSTTEWQTGSFNSNHYAAFKVSSFSGGGGGSATAGQALPVEMIYFTATKEGDNVRLDWATASEVNNEGFEVERSTDGLAFEKIAYVSGNGTTTEEMTYNFTDTDAVSGVVYYRLKQMDYDGAYEYSNIISIRIDGASLLSVYPNPTTDVLHISKKSSYSIINSQGQEVARGNDNSIDVSRLPLGLYIIRLDNSVVKRFIKM